MESSWNIVTPLLTLILLEMRIQVKIVKTLGYKRNDL